MNCSLHAIKGCIATKIDYTWARYALKLIVRYTEAWYIEAFLQRDNYVQAVASLNAVG